MKLTPGRVEQFSGQRRNTIGASLTDLKGAAFPQLPLQPRQARVEVGVLFRSGHLFAVLQLALHDVELVLEGGLRPLRNLVPLANCKSIRR